MTKICRRPSSACCFIRICLKRTWIVKNYQRMVTMVRTSRLQMFFKIGVLTNFAIFTENTSAGVSFWKSCWPATSLKRDSNAGVFCEYCKTFKNSFFYGTPLVAVFAWFATMFETSLFSTKMFASVKQKIDPHGINLFWVFC